ncbi:MAG: ferrous iron transport protein A [Verrucomicrobia bacterium]|nr:MAG: ferrous iron transport protein A [Verrucomicrobiota bacterium]
MELNIKKLANLAINEVIKIQGFKNESDEILRFQEMGLLPGTEVKIIRKGPMGWPLEINVRGYSLALRKEDAELMCFE